EAWRQLCEIFPNSLANSQLSTINSQLPFLISCFHRFCESDQSPVNSLRRAYLPLSIELNLESTSPLSSDGRGIKGEGAETLNPGLRSAATSRSIGKLSSLNFLVRWCSWLDAE